MLICICNSLTETKVLAAIAAGAQTPADVFKRCGVRRNCANCQDKIKTMIHRAPPLAQAAE